MVEVRFRFWFKKLCDGSLKWKNDGNFCDQIYYVVERVSSFPQKRDLEFLYFFEQSVGMPKNNEPECISINDTYAVTVRLPGRNLKEILKGVPDGFTPEQALLFRAFKNAMLLGFSVKHFEEWHADFLEAAVGRGTPIRLRSGKEYSVVEKLPSVAKKKTAAKNTLSTRKRK